MKNRIVILFLLYFIYSCNHKIYYQSHSNKYNLIQSGENNTKVDALVSPYKSKIDSSMNVVIGYSDIAMPKQKDVPESLLGNFVADLVQEYGLEKYKTDFCFLNSGGLRSSFPQGNITVGDVYSLMPFDNEITILTLDSNSLNPLFRFIANKVGIPVSGLKMKLNKNVNWYYTYVGIQGIEYDEKKLYKVITIDYLANGGDNMSYLSKHVGREDTKLKLRDLIINSIVKRTKANQTISSKVDQRIEIIK